MPKLQQATDWCTILRSNKFLHMCKRFSLVFKWKLWISKYILNIFPMAMFDRGYASVDSQWWLGWASLSGLGGPQEAENDDVEAESQDISFSRYGVGWEFLLGFFLEVSGSWSTNPRIIRDKMKWAPTYVNLWYTVFDEDQLLYPIRRLLHQRLRPVNLKTRRLRDGTAVHKSKFRKAVRLYFKEFCVTWAVFKTLVDWWW